jgi:hypothetical protein
MEKEMHTLIAQLEPGMKKSLAVMQKEKQEIE